jgi:hypothetical protein
MKKNTGQRILIVFLSGLLFFTFVTRVSARRRVQRIKRMKIVGHSQYLGYLNAALTITKAGAAVRGLKIYLNELPLNERGPGFYSNGTPYNYDVKMGKKIVISYIPKPSIFNVKERQKKVIIGVYKINNCIKWVFPRPHAVISLRNHFSRTVKFQWDYLGRVLNTKVTITEFKKDGRVIFNQNVVGESVNINKSLFTPGMKYRFDLEVIGPLGQFHLYKRVARGSKIDFYYWDHLYFSVKK